MLSEFAQLLIRQVTVLVAFRHLFLRRFPPREVSALFLWVDDDRTLESGRRIEPPRQSASLWLELLAVLLLALVFAGPRTPWTREAQHLVCVLDGSASMGATYAAGGATRSLRDDAAAIVEERIGDLPTGSKVTLIESGASPSLLAGPATFTGEARAALASFTPRAGRHDFEVSLALALELAGDGRVLFLTDHADASRYPDEIEVISVGRPLENAAITHAARTRAGGDSGASATDRVLVTLVAHDDRPLERTLTLELEGLVVEERRVVLEPGRRQHVTLDVPTAAGPARVRLSEDALAIDDEVYLATPPARTVTLAANLAREEAERLGLAEPGAASAIERWLALVPGSAEAPAGEADLVLGHAPESSPRAWNLVLRGGTGTARPVELTSPFLVERRHPLLDGATLDGVIWGAAEDLTLPGVPLVSAGDLPLLTETIEPSGARRRTYELNWDAARSTLQRSPDWPILLVNLAELRRRELPGPERANVAAGETFVVRGAGSGTFELVRLAPDPTELRRFPARGELAIPDLSVPGLYEVRGPYDVNDDSGENTGGAGEGDRPAAAYVFGVQFADAGESDLRALAPLERSSSTALAATRAAMTPLETILLALALVAIGLDWWVLARRRGDAREPREAR